jgi:hypothetical protein
MSHSEEKHIMTYSDPEEFIGTSQQIKADAKSRKTVAAPVVKPLAEELASPAPPITKPGSHAKHAIARPKAEYERAVVGTEQARLEYNAASIAYKHAEKAEGEALAHWIALNPPPSADAVYRAHVQRETDEKLARVARGESAIAPKIATHGNSTIDRQAAQRPRQTPQMPSAMPLRSPVVRRNIV